MNCDGKYKYIIRNNREIKIDGKSLFYKRYLSKGINYTKDLLYGRTNIDSLNIFEGVKSLNSNILTWTGLRHAVPLNLRTHPHSFTVILDLENFTCRNYSSLLIRFKYEKPKKWAKIKEEFDLEDNRILEAFSLPIRVCSEPYLRSFQYKVLNSILFTNEILFKIGYIPSPNCSFCQDTKETRNHVLFTCPFSYYFWMDVIPKILNNISSCRCLLLSDVIIGILKEGMDLVNNAIIVGNSYLWSCSHKDINRQLVTLRKFLKRNTKLKNILLSNRIELFLSVKKWKSFEGLFLRG